MTCRRYELGQKYVVHHDSSEEDNKLACGPRVLTFFLYLSDVEEGSHISSPTPSLTPTPTPATASTHISD